MIYMYEKQEEKIAYLYEILQKKLIQSGASEEIADVTVDSVLKENGFEINPPCMQIVMGYITMTSMKSGSSIKPGNIILNARKFFKALPSLILLGADVVEYNIFFKITAFITLWQELLELSKITFNEDEAIILNALWSNCKKNNTINIDESYQIVNEWRKRLSFAELEWDEYMVQLEKLEKIRCLKRIDTFMLLCEEIQVEYK